MAEILPFRAVHYNQAIISRLDDVITQPYDKISPGMQSRYYDLSPYNLVRIIRGRSSPAETLEDNVYTRAARDFHTWIENRILVAAHEPAIYPYYQEYQAPGEPENRKSRRGFIALLRLEDYAARVVYRHEQTLSGPKADRLELLKATRAHFGQIFMLYSDPGGEIEAGLEHVAREKPWESLQDEYGAKHSVWRATDPGVVEQVVQTMQPKKLVIADGHHRYETALAYRDYCRQHHNDQRSEYVMATFVRMESDGLTILPTHRLVHALPDFRWDAFLAAARESFEVESSPAVQNGADALRKSLLEARKERPSIGVYAGRGKGAILHLRPSINLGTTLPGLAPGMANLDVVILHRLLLERVLRIQPEAVREERNLHYVRDFDAALQAVDQAQAQLAFLLNPTPIEAVRDNAFNGDVLPQKSTDFYPKLLSGLAIYWLENPGGI